MFRIAATGLNILLLSGIGDKGIRGERSETGGTALDKSRPTTLGEEIATGLVLAIERDPTAIERTTAGVVDHLIDQLGKSAVQLLHDARSAQSRSDEELEARLQTVDAKLAKLVIESTDTDEDDDEDEVDGARSQYPNLKYARPKYKNVESILKYIEGKDDKGGVKLVIMNFND